MSELAGAGTLDEAKRIDDVIRKRKLPPSVRDFRIEFGADSTGDPAVTIWLVVDDDSNPSKHVLNKVTQFVRDIENDLMDLGLRHWPYVRFSPASEAKEYFG